LTDASVLIASSPVGVLCYVIEENYMFEIRRGQNMLIKGTAVLSAV